MKKVRNFISEYFFRAHDIVKKHNSENVVVMQFFQKEEFAVLSGINESLDFLQENLEEKKVKISYLPEGTKIKNKEVVLEIEGRYQDFGIYEGIIDGILSRATSIATNSYNCVLAANKKEVICMSDRSDHYCNQERDGKAMLTGGIKSFSSVAQAPSKEYKIYGSIPHALIQNFGGDLLKCMIYYQEMFSEENELIALVDFHNDVIDDSLKVLKYFGKKLTGVRVDTSILMKDKMFGKNENEYGVTPNQIKKLREALDKNQGKHVKICVSSGFNPEKIRNFEEQNTPVDAYGVGEYLLKIKNTFCADVVKINGKNVAKEGRKYFENAKLIKFEWK